MRGDAVARFDAALGHVDLGLVGDVADHAGLGAGTEQGALRTFENFDAFEVGGIDIEVARRQLAGLLVQVDGDIREPADGAARLTAGCADAETAHVDIVLTRTVACHRDIGQIPDIVIESRNAELFQSLGRQRLNGDGHVLNVFRAPLGRHRDFLDRIGGFRVGGCGGRRLHQTGGAAAQNRSNRIGQLLI